MPNVGERKSKNGITGEWDGQTWRKVEGNTTPTSADDGFQIKPGEDALASTMRYGGEELKGLAHAPMDALSGLLSAPGAAMHGWIHDIPTAIKETFAPSDGQDSLIKSVPGAAVDAVKNLALHPDALGSMLGQAVLGKVAAVHGPAALETAVSRGPALAGKAIGSVGRGMEAVGTSGPAKAAGHFGMLESALRLDPKGLAIAAAPKALEYGGRALQRGGAAVAGIDTEPALNALKNLANTDVGQAVKNAVTPEVVDDPGVASVRATVDTARNGMANGLSREQAAQRAGWPLGESSAEPHTTPGADVQAHWPYEPHVRGVNGNVISGGDGTLQVNNPKTPWTPNRSSLGGLEEAMRPRSAEADAFTKDVEPTVYAKDLLDQPGSQRFMNDEYARNKPLADQALGKNDTYDLNEARKVESRVLGAGDEEDMGQQLASLSDLDRASRLARARALGTATRTHTPLAEGF